MGDNKELSERLQAMADRDSVNLKAQATGFSEKAVGRARQHFVTLTAITSILWILAAIGFVAFPLGVLRFVWPLLAETIKQATGVSSDPGGVEALFYGTCIWGCLVVLAALCTVALVWVSRRATLRQIQHSLAELTSEVRHLSAQNSK